MTDKPTIKVENLGKLVRELRKVNPDLVKELKAANRAIADDLVPFAKTKVPVRSGRLRDSIRAGATIRSGVVRAGKKAVPYAAPIHFGWPSRRISPNPFLWDALDGRRGEIEAEYIDRVTEIVGRVG